MSGVSKNGKFDPHRELGVKPGASKDDVDRAFRRRSHETHPDKAGGTADAFIRAKTAHRLLTDPASRERWERTGEFDEPKRPEDMAAGELAGMFVQCVEHLGEKYRTEDAKKLIEENLLQACATLSKQAMEHRAQAKRWLDAAARVTHKGGDGTNLAAQALKSKAQAEERQADERDGKRRLAEEMQKLLADYDWRADVEEETNFSALLMAHMEAAQTNSWTRQKTKGNKL